MKKFSIYVFGICALAFAACDLQPKILALPDTVGEFISARYPALLADPETQPEIYNAASIDYGVYASPNLYGSVDDADYVEYASVNDYIVPPSATGMYGDTPRDIDAGAPIVTADAGDADYLRVPMYGGVTMVQSVAEITVAPGDTLYSLAQMYGTTVDALARENNLSVPYALSVGQKLKVPVEKESGAVQTVAVPADANTTTRVELSEITAIHCILCRAGILCR